LRGHPYERGFICDDPSLSLPYRPDTISTPVLIIAGFSASLFAVSPLATNCRHSYSTKVLFISFDRRINQLSSQPTYQPHQCYHRYGLDTLLKCNTYVINTKPCLVILYHLPPVKWFLRFGKILIRP